MLILRYICAFGENLWILMKKIAFRIIHENNRGSRKSRAPRTTKYSKTRQGTGVRQECTAVHPRRIRTSRPEMWHDDPMPGSTIWPCWLARPCHCTQCGRAPWHDRALIGAAQFKCFLWFLSSTFFLFCCFCF